MAQVAGVGATGLKRRGHVWRVDLMAANRLQQSVCRMRHVTVVALATGRTRRMVCVLFETVTKRFVALEACLVATGFGFELIVGPFLDGTRAFGRHVHSVAREARQLTALIAGRLGQAVEFTSRHADHAVFPKGVLDELGIFPFDVLHRGMLSIAM